MDLEEQCDVLIRRANALLKKSQLIQEKANLATRHFNSVLKSNDKLIGVLRSGQVNRRTTRVIARRFSRPPNRTQNPNEPSTPSNRQQ